MFSCQICEISRNIFSYRTPPLAASGWGNQQTWRYKRNFLIEQFKANVFESVTENSNSEKGLGVTADSKLSIDDYITNLCRKTSQTFLLNITFQRPHSRGVNNKQSTWTCPKDLAPRQNVRFWNFALKWQICYNPREEPTLSPHWNLQSWK